MLSGLAQRAECTSADEPKHNSPGERGASRPLGCPRVTEVPVTALGGDAAAVEAALRPAQWDVPVRLGGVQNEHLNVLFWRGVVHQGHEIV